MLIAIVVQVTSSSEARRISKSISGAKSSIGIRVNFAATPAFTPRPHDTSSLYSPIVVPKLRAK
jgi:hypothetical protein